ncbi:hypothetical protein BS47DRAFT_1358847 [Hydnum rufescens UP504]|uniref:Uncharacterized protein n=1 Tax=Hydnum rufescens UP504 TaxID=1448309 RepID=A0A9P6B6R3_9AGAM|nr:hypothetical protein BS47DRAFT_1358847 [Hydnum rufescens UP504]
MAQAATRAKPKQTTMRQTRTQRRIAQCPMNHTPAAAGHNLDQHQYEPQPKLCQVKTRPTPIKLAEQRTDPNQTLATAGVWFYLSPKRRSPIGQGPSERQTKTQGAATRATHPLRRVCGSISKMKTRRTKPPPSLKLSTHPPNENNERDPPNPKCQTKPAHKTKPRNGDPRQEATENPRRNHTPASADCHLNLRLPIKTRDPAEQTRENNNPPAKRNPQTAIENTTQTPDEPYPPKRAWLSIRTHNPTRDPTQQTHEDSSPPPNETRERENTIRDRGNPDEPHTRFGGCSNFLRYSEPTACTNPLPPDPKPARTANRKPVTPLSKNTRPLVRGYV